MCARRVGRRERPRTNRPWGLKTPVIIRAGTPVVVRVAARDRRHVALDWPRCVTLEFLEDGKPTVRRRLGLGRACGS